MCPYITFIFVCGFYVLRLYYIGKLRRIIIGKEQGNSRNNDSYFSYQRGDLARESTFDMPKIGLSCSVVSYKLSHTGLNSSKESKYLFSGFLV